MKARFLLARAAPYRTALAAISALSLAGSAAMLAIPWLAGQLLGGVLSGDDLPVAGLAVLLVLALTASTGFSVAAAILSARTSGRALRNLREETHAHVQSLPMAFHDRSRQGDLLALMTYEVTQLSDFLTATLASVPAMLLTALGSVILLFLIDPVVALFLPVLLPVFFIFLKLTGRRLRSLSAQTRAVEADLVAMAEEDLELLPAIKSFAVEDARRTAYSRVAHTAFDLGFRQKRLSALLGPSIALVSGLAALALLLLASDRMVQEGGDAADLFSLLFYAALLTRPIAALADVYGQFQWARGTLARLEEVLATPAEPGLAHGAAIERAGGQIAFKGVSFAYPGREAVFRGLELKIGTGEIVALTGLNGAGKSTLISLLLRYYEAEAGSIQLDGRDIGELQVQALRRQIGLVPQSPLLFAGSLRDNIALGAPEASDEQVGNAARLAQAEEFILGLKDGYATQIGDHGVRLSGGQRQRIALARALLPDPPILVFDEATAMFDMEGEQAFVAACERALAGRTVIIITHRQASLALADRIVRIEGGKALEA